MRKLIGLSTALSLIVASPTAALASDHGWVPVRADDGVGSHCIDRTKEAVTLDVKRLVVTKDVGWFTEDAKVDLLLTVSLSGSTNNAAGKSLSLPRAYSATLKGGSQGWYSAGIEESVFNTYALKSQADQVTNAHVDISIVNERGQTVLTQIALELLDITKSLPIPAGPFSEALNYADKYANGILSKVTDSGDVSKDLVKTGSLQLNFGASSGACTTGNTNEKTGTVALVKVVGRPNPAGGYPDLQTTPNGYCFRAVARPVFDVQYQAKPASGACPTTDAGWVDLKSPHVAFVLMADQITAPPPSTRAAAIVSRSAETTARCKATKSTIKACI